MNFYCLRYVNANRNNKTKIQRRRLAVCLLQYISSLNLVYLTRLSQRFTKIIQVRMNDSDNEEETQEYATQGHNKRPK